jgi:hypothetical protein
VTADPQITFFESYRAMTLDAKTTSVGISRARHHVAIYTDRRKKLADAIKLRSGKRQAALEPVGRMQSVQWAEPASADR